VSNEKSNWIRWRGDGTENQYVRRKKKVYYCKKYDVGLCCALLQAVAHQNPIVTVTGCPEPDSDEHVV
jgi:hypothetical protein